MTIRKELCARLERRGKKYALATRTPFRFAVLPQRRLAWRPRPVGARISQEFMRDRCAGDGARLQGQVVAITDTVRAKPNSSGLVNQLRNLAEQFQFIV